MQNKLNCSLIYYLLTECNNYHFDIQNNLFNKITENEFIFITKITKENQIVYNFQLKDQNDFNDKND